MRMVLLALFTALAFAGAAQAEVLGDGSLWSSIQTALTEGSSREPQLTFVMVLLAALLPALSILVLVSRYGWRMTHPSRKERGDVYTEIPMAPALTRPQVRELRGAMPLIDVIGDEADVHRLGGTMVRIGRHEENDIRLTSQTVHRYHAVLHRTPEETFVITDLSGPQGNGVIVNTERVEQAQLAPGDLIELGDVRLRFRMSEAH